MANPIRDIGVQQSELAVETASAASARAVRRDPQGASVEPTIQPVSDSTSLSPLGGLVGSAKSISVQSFRADLVARLKAQVASGTYRPDPNLVAERVSAAVKGMA